MVERLPSMPKMQERIEEIMTRYDDPVATYSTDGATCVVVAETEAVVIFVLIELDPETFDATVRTTHVHKPGMTPVS